MCVCLCVAEQRKLTGKAAADRTEIGNLRNLRCRSAASPSRNDVCERRESRSMTPVRYAAVDD